MSYMTNKAQLKVLVRGAYDVQKLRIQTGNRIVANFKAKLGQKPSESEDELDKAGKELLAQIRLSYSLITKGAIAHLPRPLFEGDEIISTFTEFCLVEQYIKLEEQEEHHFDRLEGVLKDFDIYNKFLSHVKGVGPAMAGVIVSEIDITRSKYPSSIWKYAGLDVCEMIKYDEKGNPVLDEDKNPISVMAGRSRRKGHLIKVKYKDGEGNEQERNSITFNPFLKTKLIGVLGTSFLRAGPGKKDKVAKPTKSGKVRKSTPSKYAMIYYDYKQRLENHPTHIEKSDGHRHNMAIRYMIKMFLIDLYNEWRKLEGLDVFPPYHEAKLQIFHGSDRGSSRIAA